MRSIAELMDLRGRKALLIGGAGHIGRAAAAGLVELGANAVIMDVDGPGCEEAAEALRGLRAGSAFAAPCDLLDEAGTRQAIRGAVSRAGGLDILVHCAAYGGTPPVQGWSAPFEGQTVEAWELAFKVNLTSAFIAVQEAREALAASGRGSVVLTSSIYGLAGPDLRLYEGTSMANPAGYGASKGGLLQLMRHLSTVLAPRVRVNAVSPGGVWRGQPASFVERYTSRAPLGRMAVEEDLKGAVAYLAGDLSAYVTGHNLVVDGGWTAW